MVRGSHIPHVRGRSVILHIIAEGKGEGEGDGGKGERTRVMGARVRGQG